VLHPARYFVRYLLVSLEDPSERSVNSTLRLHGVASLTKKEMARVSQELDVPGDLRLWDPTDAPTKRWLRKARVWSLVHPDDATREMKAQILEQPAVREKIDTLLMGNVSVSEASLRLQEQRIVVSVAALQEYRHYFWNTEGMGLSDWIEYFARDADEEEGSGRTHGRRSTLKSSLLGGPELAKYKAGIAQSIDGKKILSELQQELYFTFREIRTLPVSEKKVLMLSAITRSLTRLDERISSSDQALQDTLKRFEKFKIQNSPEKTPSLAQLAPTGSISSRSRTEILISREK